VSHFSAISWHGWTYYRRKKNLMLCKHWFPCNTLTHSINEDLLNIKGKGDPEVSYPLSYVRYHWNSELVWNKSHFVSLFCLQSVEFFFIHQYVHPCLLKNPKYTFYTIKSSLTLAYNNNKDSLQYLIRLLSSKQLLCSLNIWNFYYVLSCFL
jgi:hypothetical protein